MKDYGWLGDGCNCLNGCIRAGVTSFAFRFSLSSLSDLLYRAAHAIFLHIGIPLSPSVTPLRTSKVVF
ncbi:MAG: hypothetical protein WD317_02850, partial [Balneolaceae bacterium]